MVTVSVTTFGNGLSQEVRELESLVHEVFVEAVDIVEDAVVNGSPILGVPGQPDDLRQGQWQKSYENDWSAVIQTSDKSARSVEDAISYKYGTPLKKLKSPHGGFHSVRLVELGFDKAFELARLRKESGNA